MSQLAAPRYHQVYVTLRAWVRDGTYPAGAQIPTEPELCEIFGVSRITVRKAIEDLAREGWLLRQQGRGTFVQLSAAREASSLDLNEVRGHVADLAAATEVRSLVVRDVEPDEETRAALDLPADTRVQRASHVRVLRGVPHILGMSQSVKPDPNARGGIPFKLAGATGWSGDGAPGTGTLREFALGAIVQHFTKTLNRKVNVDYRVPTEEELDALLEFQLSVGRQAELKVDPALPGAIVFNDAHVERGRALFHSAPARDGSTRACASCHVGGGANDATGGGGLFATGVENVANAPACLAPRQAPGDGGFGATPVQTVRASSICGRGSFDIVFRGTRGFNPPSLIEAADTLPLFHNNSAATLEDAVRFYTTDTFNSSPAGAGRAFVLDRAGINDVAAFLRGLNLLDNAREATRLIDEAERKPASEASDTILEARANALDAVEVLARSPVALFTASRPARLFTSAARRLQDAAPTANVALMELARQDLARARDLIARNAPAG